MEQTGIFEGKIIGANTKLRKDHSNLAVVLGSHGANLIVKATKKWVCEVADTSMNTWVGDTWIYVTNIGGANVAPGWMAVIHHGVPIVNLTIDMPDEIPPTVPYDRVVVNSITLDLNAAHEIVATWVNGNEFRPYPPVDDIPLG